MSLKNASDAGLRKSVTLPEIEQASVPLPEPLKKPMHQKPGQAPDKDGKPPALIPSELIDQMSAQCAPPDMKLAHFIATRIRDINRLVKRCDCLNDRFWLLKLVSGGFGSKDRKNVVFRLAEKWESQ